MSLQNEDKVNELISDRDWGSHEDDSEFDGTTRETDIGDGNLLPPSDESGDSETPDDEAAEAEDNDDVVEEPNEELEALQRESEGRLKDLIRERQARAQMQEQLAAVNEQMEQLRNDLTQEETPNPDEDEVAYLERVNRDNAAVLQEEIQSLRQEMQYRELEREVSDVAGATVHYEQSFREQHNDYDDAFEHVRNTYVNELRSQGISDAEAEQRVFAMGFHFSKAALMEGRDPAQAIYDEARRLGFNAAGPTPEVPTEPEIKETPNRPSLSEPGMNGVGNSTARKGKVTQEWVFNNLDKGQRRKIFNDPTLNRELAETGYVTLPADF